MTIVSEETVDTGLAWLGRRPASWSVEPFFAAAVECDRPNVGMKESNLLSLSYGEIVNKNIASSDGLLPESFETYQIVEPGDVVFRFTDLQNDKRSLRSALVGERGIITSAYLTVKPRHHIPAYFAYLMRAYDASKVFYSMGGGLRQSMKYADVKRLPVLVPPLEEQRAIVDYLGRETGRIDALIAKQEQLIEVLAERRRAVVARALTRGLHSGAATRPSGVEWIGDIPMHWDVSATRYLCKIGTGSFDTADAVPDGSYPLYIRSQNPERTNSFDHEGPAVLTAGDGNGAVGKVYHLVQGRFAAHQRMYVMSRIRRVTPEYFFLYFWAMFGSVVVRGTNKSTFESLRRPMVGGFKMTVPPPDEQAEIVEHLRSVLASIDGAIASAGRLVGLLRERRHTLISAAVTGKIDMRGR